MEKSKKAGEKIDGGILFRIVLHRRFQKGIDGVVHTLEVVKEWIHGDAKFFIEDGECTAFLFSLHR